MLPRRKRFPRAEFQSAVKNGRRISSPNFSITVPKDARGYAVVVSKKTARLSVTRHKIKRRVSEALKTFHLPQSLIVFPKSSVADMKYGDIQTELGRLLSKID